MLTHFKINATTLATTTTHFWSSKEASRSALLQHQLRGTADIFSITHYFFGSQNNGFQLSSYLMGFGLGCYFIWKMNSILKSDALIPFLFTASPTFLPHLSYDYIFLLPLLFFSLNFKLNKFKKLLFFMTIFYFWFFLKIIAPFSIPYIFTAIPGFLLLLFSCELLTSCSKETLLK